MTARFGRKKKRELKQTLEIQEAKFISDKNKLKNKNNLYENSIRCLERDLYELKESIRNFLPKPQVVAKRFTEIENRYSTLVINMQAFSFKFMEQDLNERSIEFIADQFAHYVKDQVTKELIKTL